MWMETDRLLLRLFRLSDVDDYYSLLSNPKVANPNGSVPLSDRKSALKQVESLINLEYTYAIELKKEAKMIGCIGLNEDALLAENTRNIGVVLNEAYWNNGYMNEALQVVIENAKAHFKNLSIVHDIDNKKSENLAKKLGFKFIKKIEKNGMVDKQTEYQLYYLLEL